MSKLAAMILTLGVLACGSGQDAADTAEGAGPDVGAAVVPEAVQDCLDLVAGMQWSEAVPVCTDAVRESPQSVEAQAALDRARAELERLTEAAEAVEEAAEQAASALEDATQPLGGSP